MVRPPEPTAPASLPSELPDPAALGDAFDVYEIEATDDGARYYGDPVVEDDQVLEHVAARFREAGYRVRLQYVTGEHVLVAEERSVGVDGVPWTNVLLFGATVLTTLYAGCRWYGVDVFASPLSILEGWPFALAVIGVFAVHESGHYVLSRKHDVQATLPYFIPIPNLLGTFGAVIRMKDNLPSRTALFDIGVAGPLAGLVATVVVTAVGVSLPPIQIPADSIANQVELSYPPLLHGIAAVMGERLVYSDPTLMVNPVAIGGWVGALATFLNLLPVGQLDGAHVARALVGDVLDTAQLLIPAALFALAGYLLAFGDARAAPIWIVWGVISLLFTRAGGADPIVDDAVDRRRQVLGVLTLVIGLLCFTPAPAVVSV